ncbi:Na/Pi cotransporter family protein, partial [Pseudomonadota bacterium]
MAANGEQPMDWGAMTMQLLGGLALFLFGIEQMARALKVVAGNRMKLILARLTTNRFMGAITGAFVTAIIQSSSVTTVLVVGFISAGLMSMAQSVGIIMGANIGTTITAQIIAFKITKAAMLMIAAGFGVLFFAKQEKIQQYGHMLMGLGLLFFGMTIMSEAMEPLRHFQPFLDLMIKMENPLIAILIAAAFTGLIQSSSAATGIVIVMASQGFITLPAGIALAFGANIGTCITALLATIGKPREALRAAMVHVLFNVIGVLIWLGFIDHLAQFVILISPSHEELSGTARLAAETPRQFANAHTIFNLANTLIFIGLTSQFTRLVEWLIPDKPLEKVVTVSPKYLDKMLLDTPA